MKHFYSSLLVLALCGSGAASAENVQLPIDSLRFNDVSAVFNQSDNTFLLPLPTAQRGKASYRAAISYKTQSAGQKVYFDNRLVASGDSVTFTAPLATKKHTVKIVTGSTTKELALVGDFLPIVELTTAAGINGKTYTLGSITVNDADATEKRRAFSANLRYRGATAQSMDKKAFAVKLVDAAGEDVDASFFGLREDNSWILDAMAVDLARMRNRVSTDLWNDYSAKPYHQAFEKKTITNGTRGRFVEVVLNGKYHGLYCMTEKLDRKQLKLKKFKTDAATSAVTLRGLLYKANQWSYSVFMGHNSDSQTYPGTAPKMYNNNSDTWDGFEMSYPEVADGEKITWKPLYDAVAKVASNDTATFAREVEQLFDLPVALDYNLFVELLLATDNHGKNMFYYVYDLPQSSKLGIAPWDLDGTWGQDYYSNKSKTYDPEQSYTQTIIDNEHGEHTLFKRLRETKSLNWEARLKARYAELRQTHFTTESLVKRFTDYADLFAESGADTRENRRWNWANGRYIDIPFEIDYIKQWIPVRLEYLDRQFDYDATGLHTVRAAAPTLSVYGERGQLRCNVSVAQIVQVYDLGGSLVARRSLPAGISTIALSAGIYVVQGQKVIVQ